MRLAKYLLVSVATLAASARFNETTEPAAIPVIETPNKAPRLHVSFHLGFR